MSDSWIMFSIGLLFITFLALHFYWLEQKRKNAKIRIERTIEDYNGQIISIEAQRRKDDRSSFTFKVVYQNSQGERQTSYCRAIFNGDTAGQLFWQGDNVVLSPTSPPKQQVIDSLTMENEQLRATLAGKIETAGSRSDSKEQIIADLTAENERLRAMLNEQQPKT